MGKSQILPRKRVRIETGRRRHIRDKDGDFHCQYEKCTKAYKHTSSLCRHLKVVHGDDLRRCFVCRICEKEFAQPYQLRAHRLTHSDEKPFSCRICRKNFRQKAHCLIHERQHDGLRPFMCMKCGQLFSQRSSAGTHLRVHSKERPFDCSECDRKFSQKHSLLRHARKMHSKALEKRLRKKKFVVPKAFRSGSNIVYLPYEGQERRDFYALKGVERLKFVKHLDLKPYCKSGTLMIADQIPERYQRYALEFENDESDEKEEEDTPVKRKKMDSEEQANGPTTDDEETEDEMIHDEVMDDVAVKQEPQDEETMNGEDTDSDIEIISFYPADTKVGVTNPDVPLELPNLDIPVDLMDESVPIIPSLPPFPNDLLDSSERPPLEEDVEMTDAPNESVDEQQNARRCIKTEADCLKNELVFGSTSTPTTLKTFPPLPPLPKTVDVNRSRPMPQMHSTVPVRPRKIPRPKHLRRKRTRPPQQPVPAMDILDLIQNVPLPSMSGW